MGETTMTQPKPSLVGHYVKDLSFTNPGGLGALVERPRIEIGVDVQTRRGDADHSEVDLRLSVTGLAANKPLFLLRLIYGGLFGLHGIAETARQEVLYTVAAAQLLPFAQRVVTDAMRNVGLPPLTLEPIDFAALHHAKAGTMAQSPDTGAVAGPDVRQIFTTRLYSAPLGIDLHSELKAACQHLAATDEAGHRWCEANSYKGYTSYSSIDDLPRRAPVFAKLVEQLDRHVADYARMVAFDMNGRRLALDGIWVNILSEGGLHPAHFHPHSAVSGTYYVNTPKGAAGICFEDPRLGLMMSAPPREAKAGLENRHFVTVQPKADVVLLWESWLRHGVEPHTASEPRISISFNYRAELTSRD